VASSKNTAFGSVSKTRAKAMRCCSPGESDHGGEDYAELHDMDATDVGELTEDDRECLDDLGQYLVAADAWNRFGIWLLHKHFEPEPGEVFVEHVVSDPRGTQTRPIARSSFEAQELSPTAIRFDTSVDSGLGVVGMEFAEPGAFAGVSPLSDEDEAVLEGLAQRLAVHDKIERFGVRLLRDPLAPLSGRDAVGDLQQRQAHASVCRHPAPCHAMPMQTTIETNWRFRVVEGEAAPIVMVECTAGCQPVGEGHDIAHAHQGESEDFGND
jgi:hypothetical protein